MVPGLAIEEFSTPPSSPKQVTKFAKKEPVSTTNSKMSMDSSNGLNGMQLGKWIENGCSNV